MMEKSVGCIANVLKELTVETVFKYLEMSPTESLPLKPRAGEIYVFSWKDDTFKSKCQCQHWLLHAVCVESYL
jgi:hypothetical protein